MESNKLHSRNNLLCSYEGSMTSLAWQTGLQNRLVSFPCTNVQVCHAYMGMVHTSRLVDV